MDERHSAKWARLRRALVTLVGIDCLLLVPGWIGSGSVGPRWLALEGAVLVLLFALLPRRRWSRVAAGVAGAVVVLFSILLFADTAARMSLARPLNLYLDVRLVGAVRNLLDGALGGGLGLLIVVAIPVVGGGIAWAVARGLASVRRPDGHRGWRAWTPAAVLLAIAVIAIPARWIHPRGVALALPAAELAIEQTRQLQRMLGERERFAGEMAENPARYEGRPGLLGALEGRDVTLAFVESYGVAALEDPRYAPVVRPVLDSLAAAVEARGLHIASGLLIAPSQGGMSWLGHGSMLSGLWLENQLRYDLLLASERGTLVDDFEAAGYRTAALMPQITMAWPEGERFGYDEIWSRPEIDYRGPALNWVEIPDQFTWHWLEERIRPAPDDRPLFVELGLISSHAPWTPILEVEPWDAVGDGSIFERWRDAGETPEELWRDHDRVREHYALAVRYAMETATSWVRHRMPGESLLILLGDHQPAPLITGDDASRAVPVHVVAADPALVEPFRALGFVEGAVPPVAVADTGIPRMSVFRDWFVRTFGATPGVGTP